ncbi:MAG: hypothetical protein MJY69_06195 [Bacteroidales bacterium]|nr:hypothetical protein [Bacteroidales bacterium]
MRRFIKFFIAVLVLSTAMSTSAQARIYIGGHIGLNLPPQGQSGVGVNIAPEIGYYVNGNFVVGGRVSYRSRSSTFGITPFARWNFVSMGDRLRLFLSATVPMDFANDYRSIGAYLRPGVAVRLADRAWAVVHIGAFGYQSTRSGNTTSGNWIGRVDGNTINIGFCFDL